MHTFYRRTRSVVLTIASVIGALCIIAVLAGLLFRATPLIVISGSMEPDIPTGSLVITQERPVVEVAIGDVVTVERTDGHGLVTHRVEGIETVDGEISLTLKGDANTLVDPNPYTPKTVGAYLFSIPGAGNVAAFLQTGSGMLIGGALLLAVLALAILDPQRMKRRAQPTVMAPYDDPAAPATEASPVIDVVGRV